jgi:acyl CoA:acetate/3-ketoacid CoA transferase beta subunit
MPSKKEAKDYSLAELMAVLAAKEIKDGDRVFVGIGVPMIAGFLAIRTHGPNAVLMFEGGYLRGGTPRLDTTRCTLELSDLFMKLSMACS